MLASGVEPDPDAIVLRHVAIASRLVRDDVFRGAVIADHSDVDGGAVSADETDGLLRGRRIPLRGVEALQTCRLSPTRIIQLPVNGRRRVHIDGLDSRPGHPPIRIGRGLCLPGQRWQAC